MKLVAGGKPDTGASFSKSLLETLDSPPCSAQEDDGSWAIVISKCCQGRLDGAEANVPSRH